MSGTNECYFYADINGTTMKCDFTDAVTGTDVIFGKNQPFLCIEVTVSKYLFDSIDFWTTRLNKDSSTTITLTECPKPVQNNTIMYITTYGGTYELLYTQTNNPDDSTYVFMCYSKMYQMKTTNINSLIDTDVVWNGAGTSFDDNQLVLTVDGQEHTIPLASVLNHTHYKNQVYDKIQIVSPSRMQNTLGFAQKVSIGTLRVLVPIYEDSTIPVPYEGYSEPEGDAQFISAANEVMITNASMRKVYASILFQYTLPVCNSDMIAWFKGQLTNHISTPIQTKVDGKMVDGTSTSLDGILYCQGIECICGYTQAIFAWLSNKIGGFTGEELGVDAGYIFKDSESILSTLSYTKSDLESIKSGAITKQDFICKLKVDSNCYDSLTALATMTNRNVYYADKPYLSSFYTDDDSVTLDSLTIAYTASDSSYCAYFYPAGSTDPVQIKLGSGITYNDQGSTYLIGKQKASSQDVNVVVEVTDANTDVEGTPIELNINTDSSSQSQGLLAQVAFNTLVRNYHPSNTLSFIALENYSDDVSATFTAYMGTTAGLPTASADLLGLYYVNAGEEDVALYKCVQSGSTYSWEAHYPSKDDTAVVYTSYKRYMFKFNGTTWEETIEITGVKRKALLAPNTRCKSLVDKRSEKTLTNVPLSYTVLSWPDCTTRYMFGEPIFQDTEQSISALQSITAQSVTNTSISEAMNSSYSTVSIGSNSSDITDMSTYSGILMQKNDATGVASIDGYSAGQRQVRFSSEGSVSCGTTYYTSPKSGSSVEAGDTVVMDFNGFRTRSWHLYSTEAPEYLYSDGFWRTECEISTEGYITAGAGAVEIGAEGVVTKEDGNTVYALNDEGLTYYGRPIIDSSTGKINLHVDSAVIDGNLRAISITLPYVQIDNYGMRTFNRYFYDTDSENYIYRPSDLQCSIGTNGIITAGAGAVKLDATGITTWSGALKADETGFYDYSSATKQCEITTSGVITAGAGAVRLDSYGLRTYDSSGAVQCYVGTDGAITAGAGAVLLDAEGLHTKNPQGVEQCRIGTDGSIIAGTDINGKSVLNSKGLITYYPNSTSIASYISTTGTASFGGNNQQSIEINGGLIKFYAPGSVIGEDGKVTGTVGAYITNDGTVMGLATGSVDTAQLVNGSVVEDAIATTAVSASKIQDDAVTTTKIKDAAITNAKIAELAVEEANIKDLAVTDAKIANLTITNAKIVDGTITDAKISTLSATKIRTGELAVDVEMKLTNTGSALLAGPFQLSGETTNRYMVRLDKDGLTTYNSTNGDVACKVDSYGNITGISINANQITSGTISSDRVDSDTISACEINASKIVSGKLDTYTNSNVSITGGTGNNTVTIDSNGLTIGSAFSLPAGQVSGVNNNLIDSVDPGDLDFNDGLSASKSQISAGTGKVIIDTDGLRTYNSGGTKVCEVDTNGNITGISINASQITAGTIDASKIAVTNINAGNITSGTISADKISGGTLNISGGAVKIDSTGLNTYNRNTLQCSITTRGAFMAGFASDGPYSTTVQHAMVDDTGVSILGKYYESESAMSPKLIKTPALNFYGWKGSLTSSEISLIASISTGCNTTNDPLYTRAEDLKVELDTAVSSQRTTVYRVTTTSDTYGTQQIFEADGRDGTGMVLGGEYIQGGGEIILDAASYSSDADYSTSTPNSELNIDIISYKEYMAVESGSPYSNDIYINGYVNGTKTDSTVHIYVNNTPLAQFISAFSSSNTLSSITFNDNTLALTGGYYQMGKVLIKWGWFGSKSYGDGSTIPFDTTVAFSCVPVVMVTGGDDPLARGRSASVDAVSTTGFEISYNSFGWRTVMYIAIGMSS